ncbi:hypothetical protein [Bosea sp. (in: a-proteobacteria)]|uniref:hypothetical protein n=1 Tax=Bosea sp. (in: a-proteobacteria) TaxID=1871050 RepID=UPI0025B903B9|nr:hypothetical protein [Bosea sp. (in: a-proteobacteria)]
MAADVHDIGAYRTKLSETATGLKGNGGGGTSDGMEARVAKLEADIGHIKTATSDLRTDVRELRTDARTDFRLLFGALIFVALGLAGLMAKGFKWL